MSPVKILIADDHELVRKGLVSIVSGSHPEWQVAAEAAAGTDAVDLGTALRPDLAILDLSMPDMGGLQVAERLMESVPGIKIIILTVYAAEPVRRRLRKAGVSAYLAKNEAPNMLVRAMERVLAGEPFFASSNTSRSEVQAPEYIPVQFVLTPRELDVLRLLARGKTNKELAAELGVSVRTAESHHANLLAKLDVESLADVVRIALRDGVG